MALSKRELHARLAAAGRPVSFLTISEWLTCGLMPPLAARSLGLNKGKVCYWTELNTFERASLIYDLFEAGNERHEIYWLLWLCGLSVPLAQLRRAWLHKAREQDVRMVANAANSNDAASGRGAGKSGRPAFAQSLLEIAMAASVPLAQSCDLEIDALVEAMDFAGAGAGDDDGREAARLLKAVWANLRRSDIIVGATDEELREAQRLASAALRDFQKKALTRKTRLPSITTDWPVAEARDFGAPLFFMILVFLRSGQRALADYLAWPEAIAEATFRRTKNSAGAFLDR